MLTSPIAIAQIRKSEDIPQTYALAHTGQHKLHSSTPVFSLNYIVLLLRLHCAAVDLDWFPGSATAQGR